MDKYLKFKQAIVWDKNLLGIGWHYRRSYEFIMVAEKKGGSCKWMDTTHRVKNIIQNITGIIPRKDQHPTEKPVELMARFIKYHTEKNDIVLDPFLGSGTTAVACKLLNRRFIGIEISPEYCKIAQDRVDRTLYQPDLLGVSND
jgi:DNA modification methylase